MTVQPDPSSATLAGMNMPSTRRVARMQDVGPTLVAAFRRVGLPGTWGLALARQESDFIPTGVNRSAADARRGFSWGLCQMSLQTAREELGYSGDGPGLLDPKVNARLAAEYCRKLCDRHKVTSLMDVASLYNSGRPYTRAPEPTRTSYVPRVVQFAADFAIYADSIPKEDDPHG